jgi:hypothetical protein
MASKESMSQDKAYYFLIWFYALCFMVAGLGHVADIWSEGWMPYVEAPDALNFYWTSLAAADFSAVVLLLARPRVGLALAILIMVSDVLINSYATYAIHVLAPDWPLQLQSLFLGLVLGGTPYLWKKTSKMAPFNPMLDIDAQVRRSA